jgi:hypothetical protein
MGHLLVRQLAAESTEQFAVWLRTDAAMWNRQEQFEVLVSFAATLVEDLFRSDKLSSVALDAEPPVFIRRLRDLEAFLDRVALLEPTKAAAGGAGGATAQRANLITFAPDGPHGVAAWVHGQKLAAT